MYPTSLKGNCIREIKCLDEISKVSSSVSCVISALHCDGDCMKEEEVNITIEEDDLLPSNYLDRNIFGLLIPALEETLIEASKRNVLRVL